MAVEAEGKGDRREVGVLIREAIERKPQPELCPVGVHREAGSIPEDTSEVEGGRMKSACECLERVAPRRAFGQKCLRLLDEAMVIVFGAISGGSAARDVKAPVPRASWSARR